MQKSYSTSADAAVDNSGNSVVVETSELKGAETMSFDVTNTGGTALSSFIIQLKFSQNGNYQNAYGGSDFTSPYASGVEWVTSTSPATLGAGQSARGRVNVKDAYSARIIAAVAAGNTTVSAAGLFNTKEGL